MTSREALQSVTQALLDAAIEDARAEAELLVGHVLSMSRTQLYTTPERELMPAETERLATLVRRRLEREPAAYILGHCRFYDIDFQVDRRTLIPRPETELLVEKALEIAHRLHEPNKHILIADIGTGCGAIAVSLALALPEATIYATDVSPSALQVAEKNCRRHAVDHRVRLLAGNLLEPLPHTVDMVVANLPYVRSDDLAALSPEIRGFEPLIALAGGEDGLDKIRETLEQSPSKLTDRGCLVLEIGQGQAGAVTSLVERHFPQADVELVPDLAGIPRVITVVPRNSLSSRGGPENGKE
ncbi:MAG: peptide chain release factor N(5)-glutamine methyltransferase [Dehalococcoidia bacterium]